MAASAVHPLNLFLQSGKRVNKTEVGPLRKFPNVLQRTSKLFLRSHVHHLDIIHDQAYKFSFHQKLQS